MTHVEANGVEIDYFESGSGEPLLLLHGGESDRHQFDVFRPLLADGIRAIAYDQRDSPTRPYAGSYTMQDHADDCAAFIAALGYERAHLMGTSYGGAVAMTTAIRHPDRVQSLVLAATMPATDMVEPGVTDHLKTLTADEKRNFMLSAVISPAAIDNDPKLRSETEAVLRTRSADATARRMAAVYAHDCRARLPTIAAPTIVLHGDEDRLVALATAEWMASEIPGAEFRVLKGSRHGVTLEHRERTAKIVSDFVLAHPGAAVR